MEEGQLHIPDGWEGKELGTLYLEKRKSKFKVSDATNYGGIPFYTSGDAVLEHNEIQTDGENIFLATGGIANVKFYNGKVAYSTDTYVIVGKENISTQFLYFKILDQLYYIDANYFQGSGLKHLQKKDFRKHLFSLPKTEIEQTSIANILSKTDQAIAHTEALIAKYTRIKTGLMQDLLTKGIDEKGSIRSEQTHEFKDSPLGRIPKEWDVFPINKFCELIVDCKNRTSPFVDKSDYPVIRTSNIKNGSLVWDDMKYTDYSSYKIWTQRAIPQPGDVIITREAPLGQTLKIPVGFTPVLGQRTMLYRVNPDKLLSDFLVYLVMDERMQKYLNSICGGSTVHHLKVGEMREFLIAVPSTIAEQNSILDLLTNTQNNIDELKEKTLKLQSLKTGLMQDLLSGKVRVNNLMKEKQN